MASTTVQLWYKDQTNKFSFLASAHAAVTDEGEILVVFDDDAITELTTIFQNRQETPDTDDESD